MSDMPAPLAPQTVNVTSVTQTGFTVAWTAAPEIPDIAQPLPVLEAPRNVLARIDADRVLDVRFDLIADPLAAYEIYVDGALRASITAGSTPAASISLLNPIIDQTYSVTVKAVRGTFVSPLSEAVTARVPIAVQVRREDISLHAEARPNATIYPYTGEQVRIGVNWAGNQETEPFATDWRVVTGSAVHSELAQNAWISGAIFSGVQDDFSVDAYAYYENGTVARRRIEVIPTDG